MLVLKGRNNGLENQYFLVNKSLLVGRSRKCDLTLADGRTSRQQARFLRVQIRIYGLKISTL